MMASGFALILLGGVMLSIVRPGVLVWDWRDWVVLAPIVAGVGLCFASMFAVLWGALP